MDYETRRAVDEACLRLLGYDPQWDADYGDWAVMIGGSRRHRRPSTDPALVVPLLNALRALGWHVSVRSCWLTDQWAAQLLHGKRVIDEYADTMPLALALAAAKAVGEEQTNDKI